MGLIALIALGGLIFGGAGGYLLARRIGGRAYWLIWTLVAGGLFIFVGLYGETVGGVTMFPAIAGFAALAIFGGLPAIFASALGGTVGGHRARIAP